MLIRILIWLIFLLYFEKCFFNENNLLSLRNYKIRLDLIFLSVRSTILKLHIKLIIKLKHIIYLFMHINMLLYMIDGYGHLKTNVIVFFIVERL